MTKSKNKVEKGILATVVGGILLFAGNIIVSGFVASPPSRAEFDSLKVQTIERNISIDRRLEKLDAGQTRIINLMIEDGRKNGE